MADALLRIDDLRRRVQKDSASLAFAQLGEELRRAGELEEAIRVCRAGLEYHPEYVSARVTLGRALLASNNLDDAFNELSDVLRTAPENLAALRGLGETHQRRGDQPAALGVFRRALALAPHDAELGALVNAIQPSGNGDSRTWPPPSGSHPIAKPSQKTGPHPVAKATPPTGPHAVARVTPPTGPHPIVKPGPIGLPVNEIEGRQPVNGDARTAALDLLGAPPSDAERDHLALDSERIEPSRDFHVVESSGSTQEEAPADLHDLLLAQPMADDLITPDPREMLASWSVAPVEPPPAPEEPPPAPADSLPAEPPPLQVLFEAAPAALVPHPALTPEPVIADDPVLATMTAHLTVETPLVVMEPQETIADLPPLPMQLAADAPAPIEPELNPIEAAQVALLERWLESIRAAREQDHNPAK